MFKKTIKFEDFNGQEHTRDFYFHLSKAELMALASDGENSMQSRVKRITESQDGIAVLNEFRALIEMSVGMRSEDGSRFIKNDAAKSELLDLSGLRRASDGTDHCGKRWVGLRPSNWSRRR
jgi:hypothetical protein